MEITKETRQESYIQRPVTRQEDILRFLGKGAMTARQIAYGMGYTDLNAVKPRITELKAVGKIKAIGKAYDNVTKRQVAVYRVVNGGTNNV